MREWEGLRRYSSLECRKKARNEGSEKQCGKNRIEGKYSEEKAVEAEKEKEI